MLIATMLVTGLVCLYFGAEWLVRGGASLAVGIVFGKLMARTMMDPKPNLENYIRGHVEPVGRRFDAALMRAMPELTPEDVFWRMHLLVGGLNQSLLMVDRKPPSGVPPLQLDAESYLRRFVVFAASVFRAPLSK